MQIPARPRSRLWKIEPDILSDAKKGKQIIFENWQPHYFRAVLMKGAASNAYAV